jgi:CRP-like cAMP-binding protein
MQKLPLHRFSEFVCLTSAEVQAIERLSVDRLHLKRHDTLRSQGDPVRDVYLLVEGWVGSCVDVATGTRQMVKVHLPGDLLGTPSITVRAAADTLVALKRTTVEVIPVTALAELFMSMPRVAAGLYLTSLKERVFLMDRLTSVARTNAVQRLAAFLVSIHERLLLAGLEGPQFDLPLSQIELADVIGITPVHANRTWAQLERTGLVRRSGKTVSLVDIEGLRDLGAVPDRRFERLREWSALGTDKSPWQADRSVAPGSTRA